MKERVGKLKKQKAAGMDEVTGNMVKGRGDTTVDLIWRLFNIDFENGVLAEDWRSAVTVPLSMGNGTECRRYRVINLLSVVGKIYEGILVDKVHRVTEVFIDEDKDDFTLERGCVDQIFTLKQIGEKAQEKKRKIYMWVLWIWRRQMIGSIGKHYGRC